MPENTRPADEIGPMTDNFKYKGRRRIIVNITAGEIRISQDGDILVLNPKETRRIVGFLRDRGY